LVPGQLLEMTNMRRAIAEHMVRSKQTAPHVTTVHEVDMSAVTAAYRTLKDSYAGRGVKLTYTAFIVQVLAEALAEHPIVNSSFTPEGIQLHSDVNIGMAVAVPTGLIVPVIRNANEKSLPGIAREVNDLAARARNKQLVPDDVQGGTFTFTNYGTLGSLFGTPVINQPQAAILGTGAIRKQVVVVEGPDGDSIAIRPTMFLSLTFDHRVLDGGTADPFVQTIVRKLQEYSA
jgi:2-oxoglutarate dehydrogenase E2 component (dihydrolipoamide succinyltransferase)